MKVSFSFNITIKATDVPLGTILASAIVLMDITADNPLVNGGSARWSQRTGRVRVSPGLKGD